MTPPFLGLFFSLFTPDGTALTVLQQNIDIPESSMQPGAIVTIEFVSNQQTSDPRPVTKITRLRDDLIWEDVIKSAMDINCMFPFIFF